MIALRLMFFRRLSLMACLAAVGMPLPTHAQPAGAPSAAREATVDGITFPKTSVFEVLTMYESLTGKRIIRDSNLSGPELSIVVAGPMPKSEAIRILESSLLLSGYSIIPVDERTVKVLGPSRAPRSEGLPLYTDETILPMLGDRVISFFKPLKFLAPADAIPVVQGVVQANAFGAITAAPSANAVIITDKTPVVEKALAVLELIDREPAQVVTRFVPLERANVEDVVELLDEMFGTAATDSSSATGNNAPPAPAAAIDPETGVPMPGPPVQTTGQYEDRILPGKTKFLADTRTNRILVITRAENIRYVSEVIRQLDAAGSFEQPFVRALNYLSVVDAFPVLTDMLAEANQEGSGAASPQATPQNPFTQGGGGQGGGFGSGQGGSGSSGGGFSRPDRLTNEAMQTPPLSASLGNIRLIGDTSENTIIVYGPPDTKQRAKQILELLDRRPRQVYLAAVIGQLRVGDDLDYGVSYLVRYQNFRPLRSLIGDNSDGAAGSVLSPRLFPGIDVLPDPSSLVNPDTFAALSGLTIYGSIAESVDVFARFLETTNRFQTLARPVVYTTNNKKATILSGQRVPVPTSTLTTATGGGINNNGTAVTSNIQFQDVVLKLEVIPLINSDDEVNLIIAQTNDSIIGFDRISDNDVPRIATQEITTSVRVKSGSTIVLGGLITEQNERLTDGIPYISKIPIIGPIFGGSNSKSAEKSELIVMIQPIVVDTEDDAQRASMQEGMRSQLGSDAYELTARPAPYNMDAPPVPTPSPTPKKRSWIPWMRPKAKN